MTIRTSSIHPFRLGRRTAGSESETTEEGLGVSASVDGGAASCEPVSGRGSEGDRSSLMQGAAPRLQVEAPEGKVVGLDGPGDRGGGVVADGHAIRQSASPGKRAADLVGRDRVVR